MVRFLSVALVVTLAFGCSTPQSPHDVNAHLRSAIAAAQQHIRQNEAVEANLLLSVVESINGEFPGLTDLRGKLSPDSLRLLHKPLLGSNKALRIRVERPLSQRVMLYVPDRLLDLIDVVTFDVHVGSGLYANAHVTRAGQAGLGVRATAGLGAHSQRSIGT